MHARGLGGPSVRPGGLIDVLAVMWVALWVVVALAVADEMRNLGRLSVTVDRVGRAAVTVGDGLSDLSSVPFVGGRVDRAGAEIRAAGVRASAGASESKRSVRRLSVLLGLSIAVLPTAPLLLYVPLRLSRIREARTLRRLLAQGGDAVAMERFLAERAVANLSYAQLRKVSEAPWRDLDEGRYGALALAELERVGVAPSLARSHPRGGSG